jgi:hypothetical protein
MSKTGKFLKLEKELKGYKKMMGIASDTIMDGDVSEYPIFVIHQQTVELGIPIAKKEEVEGNWSVNASSLEEMVSKQIVHQRRIEEFKKVYKDPKVHLCLFVLSELGAQFIFIPRF